MYSSVRVRIEKSDCQQDVVFKLVSSGDSHFLLILLTFYESYILI